MCIGRFSWYKTVCPSCASVRGYEPLDETVDELTPSRRGTWSVTTADGDTQVWDLYHGEVRWEDGEKHSAAEILTPPRVNGFARILLPDGTELVSGLISQIRRVR